MDVHFTARKFKAHYTLKEHAVNALSSLDKYYDGIVRGDVVLSYERTTNSLKTAEINLHIQGVILTAKEKSEDFDKSIELAVEKIERQLTKYKTKQKKNKKTLRRVKETVPESGDEE
ncbi:MAG: ribosome-associated translation inhibitor RaiA [Ignavibacteriales bacterium]|nr:ribosome-associated translation inhibitor RaiA [Ignavibacteriales bacterium]